LKNDDVVRLLKDAHEAVEASGIPTDLRAPAFKVAAYLLAGDGAPRSVTPKPHRDEKPGSGGKGSQPKANVQEATADSVDEEEFFSTFARESKVDEERLRRVYYFDKGQLRLGVSRSSLGDSITNKNQAIAILLAGAKWYAHGERSIVIGDIRDLIVSTGIDPTKNLGSHIEHVDGTIHTGKGNAKAIRVQEPKFRDFFSAAVDAVLDD